MNSETVTKGLLTLIFAGVAAYFRQLALPLLVLVAVMAIDYITGLLQAWVSKTLSSRVGIVGIVKKVSYLFEVAVAVVADYVIRTMTAYLGVDLGGFYVFGLLVCVWLIINECISILENIAEIGGPKILFLNTLLERLKKTTEEKGEDAAN